MRTLQKSNHCRTNPPLGIWGQAPYSTETPASLAAQATNQHMGTGTIRRSLAQSSPPLTIQQSPRKRFLQTALLLAALSLVPCGQAGFATNATATSAIQLGAGGGSAATSHYANTGAVGGLSNRPASASTSDQTRFTSFASFLQAVAQARQLLILITPNIIAENDKGQLQATLILDDDTVVPLNANEVLWQLVNGSSATISLDGTVSAHSVYADRTVAVEGSYDGMTKALEFTIANTNSDDYHRYAGDGLPDDWQVRNFGEDNPAAHPSQDADGDLQNNDYEFEVGTDPNDPASHFRLAIRRVDGKPDQKQLVFSPAFPNREYTVQYRTSLADGTFADLKNGTTTQVREERTVTDPNAGDPEKLYRVKIVFP